MLRTTGSRRLPAMVLCAGILALAGAAAGWAAPSIGVQAVLQSQTAVLGGSDRLRIEVHGSDRPEKPQIPPITGGSLNYSGGSSTDSTSITVINGKESTAVSKGYLFTYSLSPTRLGTLTIPAVAVRVGGRVYHTQPLTVRVTEPKATTAFLLDLSLSHHHVYVGEPVVLTVEWYISKDVSSVDFHLPILRSSAFTARPLPTPSGANTLQLPLEGSQVTATRSVATAKGRRYTLITFKRLLLPKRPGHYSFPHSSVDLVAQPAQSSFFGGLFSNGPGPRHYVVPGPSLELEVKGLPAVGRPAGFAGLIGHFSVSATASPTTVHVGDPITLNVKLHGDQAISIARLPPLRQLSGFGSQFTISSSHPAAQISGSTKSFTRVLRATTQQVTEIPGIALSYFNPTTGRYEVTRSKAIPLHVRATRIVTAKDLQGASPSSVAPAAPPAKHPQPTGLEPPVTGARLLLRRATSSPVAALLRPTILAIWVLPLTAWLLLLGWARLRRRRERPRVRLRESAAVLRRIVEANERSEEATLEMIAALRKYLHLRFGVDPVNGPMTELRARLPSPELAEAVEAIVSLYERHRFSTGSSTAVDELWERSRYLVGALEEV